MKITSLSLILIGFFASVAAASAEVSVVNGSNALHVASVNELGDDAPWYPLQQAFCASLTEQLTAIGERPMSVKVHVRDSVEAAEALLSGKVDAAFVMGDVLPISLRNKSFVSVKAVSMVGTPVRTFHFVLRKNDPSLVNALVPRFERATSSASFQDTVARAATIRVVASR